MFLSRTQPWFIQYRGCILLDYTFMVPPSVRKTKTSPTVRPEKSNDTSRIFNPSQGGALLSCRHASVCPPLSCSASSSASMRFSIRPPAPLASLSTIPPLLLTASCWGYFSWSGGQGRVHEHAHLALRAAQDSTSFTDDEVPHDNIHPAQVTKIDSRALSLSSV